MSGLLLALALAPSVFAAPSTRTDAQDAAGVDVESVSHDDADGIVKYTVQTFAPVRADEVGEMRWELDLDGDGSLRGSDDACVVMEPVRGTRRLRAGLFEGCSGSPIASADARADGQLIKLRLLVSELERAGLDDDAPGYAYRFTSVDRGGSSDSVPDAAGALITHALSGRESDGTTTNQIRAAESPTPSPTPKPSMSPTPTPRRSSGRDTTSTGTADESVVEPGQDVDIEGGGFARRTGLAIFLFGNATSTAKASPTPTASPTASPSASPTARPSATPTPTPTPSPSPSPSPTPAGLNPFTRAQTHTADVVSGQRVLSEQAAPEPAVMAAAAVTRVSLGIALSDDDGTFSDDVEIPEGTRSGKYRIVVQGSNPRGGTNIVTIPIRVAAETDDSAGAPGNATDTATQASPTSGTTGGRGGRATLPKTGSSSLQAIFGLGLLALALGGSMLGARRIAGRRPALATSMPGSGSGPSPWTKPARLVFDVPDELRGEMQRLLARRTDRYDPDRHTDL